MSRVISIRVDEDIYSKLELARGDKRITDYVKEQLKKLLSEEQQDKKKQIAVFKDFVDEITALKQAIQDFQNSFGLSSNASKLDTILSSIQELQASNPVDHVREQNMLLLLAAIAKALPGASKILEKHLPELSRQLG
ncbi:MAG: hypothetical protein ACOYW7_02735 [Nitrospirota bacterium]